jgi:hypothetical protein
MLRPDDASARGTSAAAATTGNGQNQAGNGQSQGAFAFACLVVAELIGSVGNGQTSNATAAASTPATADGAAPAATQTADGQAGINQGGGGRRFGTFAPAPLPSDANLSSRRSGRSW